MTINTRPALTAAEHALCESLRLLALALERVEDKLIELDKRTQNLHNAEGRAA